MEQVNKQMNGEVKQIGVAIVPDQRDEYIARANGEIEACHTLIARNDRKIQLMRQELQQYRNDLVYWKSAHAADYPLRRLVELDKAIQEIDAV